jgi:two-component system, chemotaxis family, sensor kinase CheA
VSFFSDEHAAELRELFFESANEILQSMNEAGLALEEKPSDVEQLRHVRRAVHTLKGDSAACGFRELSELAHELEDTLTPELAAANAGTIAEIVLIAADTFDEMLLAYRNRMRPPSGSNLRDRVHGLLSQPAAAAADAPLEATFAWTEYERLLIADAIKNGDSVFNLALFLDSNAAAPAAAVELSRKALAAAGRILAIRPETPDAAKNAKIVEAALATNKSADWLAERCSVPSIVDRIDVRAVAAQLPASPRDLLEILLQSEAQAAASAIPAGTHDAQPSAEPDTARTLPANPAHGTENSLRVDANRIDVVLNLVGEMIIGKSMLQRAIAEFDKKYGKDPLRAKLGDALAFQSRILGELQKSVMKIRMVAVDQLFRRFPRVVRDVAKQRNKEIALEIAGQNTDLDKGILDALAEPISHLVRNAADHGIEPPSERLAAGKLAQGKIRLDAYHDGDQVVIKISDDGRGLDREKILSSAIDRRILTSEEAARLNDAEVLQLIFAPGLSTANEVTEISGRGMGMDVVKSAVAALKGSIQIESEAGKGATIRLLVPLTLASIQALLFRVRGTLYAVPLASVVEITRVGEQEVHRVDEHEVFRLREEVLTLIRLEKLGPQIVERDAKRLFVIVIDAGTRRFGLVVDALVGEEELVIKALEDELSASPLVSGASILGDGTVVLILNVPAVVAHLTRVPVLGAA